MMIVEVIAVFVRINLRSDHKLTTLSTSIMPLDKIILLMFIFLVSCSIIAWIAFRVFEWTLGTIRVVSGLVVLVLLLVVVLFSITLALVEKQS